MDRIDVKILDALQRDGRLSNADLAARVGLSDSPCSRRVRQLEAQGYIERYVALLNRRKLGLTLVAYVQVNLKEQTEKVSAAFKEAVLKEPEVVSCYVTSGGYDFLLKVIATDMEAFADFTLKRLQNLPSVQAISSSFVLEVVKQSTELPTDNLLKGL